MKKQSTTEKTVRLFWSHIHRYPLFFYSLVAIVPLNVIIGDFLAPYITSRVLLKISQGAYDAHRIAASFGPEIIAYAICVVISAVIGWRLTIWLIWKLEVNVTRDIAQKVFTHLMKMSADFHANHFGGSLVSQANKLTGSYVRFIDSMVFNLFPLLITLVATIAILAPRVPLYALAVVFLSVIYIAGAFYFSKPVRAANVRESEAQSQQTGFLADSITNVMAIKSFAAGKHEEEGYWRAASHTRAMGLQSMYTTTKRESYASVITSSLSIAALLIAVVGVSILHANIQTVFLMVTYTGALSMRLWDFQNVLRQYNRAMGDASDMVKILDIEPSIKDAGHPEVSRIHAGSINFDNVTFAHAGAHKTSTDEALFRKLNLHIKPGEKVGLVGQSGSGKTTLTKLLLRFSEVDSGRITIDGQNIADITQDDLRSSISYVPQEPLLFHRSIQENIAYGRPEATQREVEIIARNAHADGFIARLPEKYGTMVGERGVKLSGGQRQRIAIARAMIKNAPILVLDEATSALDSESEMLIQDALWKLMEGRTAIVIAHRLSTIQKMDRIVVLHEGAIVEQGSHKELIKKGGNYAKLWAHQSGGFIED
jgi:ATP-binding cassette, subfamily B, bacterial